MEEFCKKPSIRFSGFTDDWEQRKLSNIAEIIDGDRGKNYPSGDDFTKQGHTLFLSAANVTKEGFSFINNQYITENKSNELGNGKLYFNDIVLTSRGSLGYVGWYNSYVKVFAPFARINSGMLIIRVKEENEASYIAQYLKSPLGKKKIDSISFGSAQPQLTKKDVSNYFVSVPGKNEQKLIGDFFMSLDNTITLHQRKLKEIELLKKTLLNKLFPNNGNKIPDYRFTGFTEDWEQRKLGEITNIKTGSSDLQDAISDGEYPFFVRSENVERSNRYIFDGEAILIPGEGRLGDIYHYINGKFDFHQRVYKISDFEDLTSDGKFVLYYLRQNFKRHALKFTVKATVDSLRLPMLVNFGIKLPSLEEQKQIGSFFEILDNTITLHQRKTEQLELLKKYLLKNMFV